jgi:excinuclease UvrABC nuclease subunit
MNDLAAETKFEEAEIVHRRLDKIRRARQEYKDIFFSVWKFDYLAILASDSVSRCKIAFIRRGQIVGFEQYEVASLTETLKMDMRRLFTAPAEKARADAVYDEFCLVSNFIVDPLQSVDLLRVANLDNVPEEVIKRVQQRKRRRKSAEELATKGT